LKATETKKRRRRKKMGHLKWGKLKDAQVYGRGSYLKPGSYKLTLLKMFTIETQGKGPALIVDFHVEESTNDEIPVGSKRNWYQGLQNESVAFSAIKELLLALFAIDQSDDDEMEKFEGGLEELMEECADPDWKAKPDEEHPLNQFK